MLTCRCSEIRRLDGALLPGRHTQPHARPAIRLPPPPLAPRPTRPRPLTSTHWRPLTRRNTPLGRRFIRRRPANSRRATTPAPVTRRSDGRSSTPRRQFARLCGGCRFAALAAVGWAHSYTSSTQAFAADQRQRAVTPAAHTSPLPRSPGPSSTTGTPRWLCSPSPTAVVRDQRPHPQLGGVDVRQF